MVDHQNILNQLLAKCGGTLPDDAVIQNDGFQKFVVKVLCGTYNIEAKLLNDRMPFKYEVRSFTKL